MKLNTKTHGIVPVSIIATKQINISALYSQAFS